MVTRGETADGEVRYFLRSDKGKKRVTVIIHDADVNEALLAGHLYQFEDECESQAKRAASPPPHRLTIL
jgi:hypothetical protein